ncbi:MAG: ATP-binding protein [Alphaproteobacteria bacterium]
MARAFRLKRLIPRGLFGRSLLLVIVPLVIVQAVVVFVFFDLHIDKISQRMAGAVAGESAALVALFLDAGDTAGRAAALRLGRDRLDLLPRFVPDAVLDPGADIGSGIVPRSLRRALDERLSQPFTVDADSLPRDVVIAIALPDGVLEVVVRNERLFSGTAYVTLLWMVGTSLLTIALAIHFLRKQVRPLRRLAEAAESFGMGRIDVELTPHGAREVRRAARAFLAMRERIQRQVQQRTQMLAGVSHDLRTPLTRMKLELAMLPRSEMVENLEAEVRAMERMVDGYLAFARGEETETPAPTDLGVMLRDLVERARGHTGDVRLACDGDLTLEIRPVAIRRALDNLIDNAVRYGSHVAVTAAREGETIVITVDDDGPGVPPAAREDVFKPFQRMDEARGADTGGVGLGLTIARDAVRHHGGDVVLADSPSGGLRAVVRLPL